MFGGGQTGIYTFLTRGGGWRKREETVAQGVAVVNQRKRAREERAARVGNGESESSKRCLTLFSPLHPPRPVTNASSTFSKEKKSWEELSLRERNSTAFCHLREVTCSSTSEKRVTFERAASTAAGRHLNIVLREGQSALVDLSSRLETTSELCFKTVELERRR